VPGTRFAPRCAETLLATALLAVAACAPAPPPAPGPAPGVPAPGPPAPGVPALPRAEPAVRVGLAVDTAAVELGSTAGFALLDTAAGDRVVARGGAGDRLRVSAGADGVLQVAGANGQIAATGRGPLLARPERGSTVTVGGRPYHGSALVQTASAGRVTAINLVEMEAYLLGVVPHEIGRVGVDLLEAAKAQAVAARTYAVAHRGRRSALGFDYYATVQDQVYGGAASEHDVTTRAVRETEGIVALYQGAPIEAYYHSTCAGRTAAIEEVWNDRPRPYLVSVIDVNPRTGQAYDHFSNRFRWTQRWTAQQLNQILARTLADSLPAGVRTVGELRNMQILERTESGRVRRMRIETTTATFHIGRDRLRWILATPGGQILNSSLLHEIELTRNGAGRVTEIAIHGGGWGHGIGMCQVGAMGRARDGQDYRTIMTTYYPGTELRRLY
jgi:stage II sporulation protein D